MKKTEWRKLPDDLIDEFKNMLKVLNRFYENKESEDSLFRKELISSDKAKIYLKRLSKFDYSVYAEIGTRKSVWIHLDGIAEDRERLHRDHPVHKIPCMTDLFLRTRKSRKIIKDKFL